MCNEEEKKNYDFMKELEEITRDMTLREKCDYITNEIRLINCKPNYDLKIED